MKIHTPPWRMAAAGALLGGALAACSPLPAPAPPAAAPGAPTAAAAKSGPSVPPPVLSPAPGVQPSAPSSSASAPAAPLNIDPARSLIAVTVRRGGVLARLGHDHVVAARAIGGTVSPAGNRADIEFRLDQMTVDEPELRAIAGLDKQPSADAVAGTRHNMLTKVLDAERYPLVAIHAERDAPGQPLRVAITLHGVTRRMAIPAELRETAGMLAVSGTVDLKQSDFGLVPFSVMGGAMSVQDSMELRFNLVAR